MHFYDSAKHFLSLSLCAVPCLSIYTYPSVPLSIPYLDGRDVMVRLMESRGDAAHTLLKARVSVVTKVWETRPLPPLGILMGKGSDVTSILIHKHSLSVCAAASSQ